MLAAVLCRVRLRTAIATIFKNCKCDTLLYTNFIKSNIKLLLSLHWNLLSSIQYLQKYVYVIPCSIQGEKLKQHWGQNILIFIKKLKRESAARSVFFQSGLPFFVQPLRARLVEKSLIFPGRSWWRHRHSLSGIDDSELVTRRPGNPKKQREACSGLVRPSWA